MEETNYRRIYLTAMPLQSRFSVAIPQVSVPSWLFTSPSADLPDIPIVLDPLKPSTRFLTLSTYRRNAQRFAAGLRAAGLQTGDRVMYVAGNSLAFYAVYMGTLMAGGVFSGASPGFNVSQIAHQAENTACKFFLSSPQTYSKCVEALKRVDIPAQVVYLVDREPLFNAPSRNAPAVGSYHDWAELLGNELQGQGFDWNFYCTDPEQLAVLNYTSGSTGLPKGVMTSHRNQVANSTLYIRIQGEHPGEQARTKLLSWVGWLPMVYVFGQTQYLLTSPKRGTRNYLMETFDLNAMISFIEKYRTTELIGIPSIVTDLVNSSVARKADLTCITSVQIGGAPLKRPICERLEAILGHPGLVTKQGWGMTELTCLPICWHPLDNTPSTSVGELLPNCEGMVLSVDGTTELGPGERGELLIRAPIITQGYWNLPEQTKQTYRADGWLRTGDLAYYDKDGKWFVLERLRELILTSKGHQIVPSEVESVLLDIRGVTDAGVLSVDVGDGSSTEARAFVVLDPHTDLTVKDVQNELAQKLDDTQQMAAGIFAIDYIPRLPGAKLDRVALRKLYAAATWSESDEICKDVAHE